MDWLSGKTEMARRVLSFDWAASPLGPMESWQPELRSAVSMALESGFPMALVWGPEMVTIYNDGFRVILGAKPEALGRSFADIWAEAWETIGPIAARAYAGEATFIEDFPLVIERNGESEMAHFTFSYSPVRGADGTVVGMIDTVIETTGKVAADRALRDARERLRHAVDSAQMGTFVWFIEEDRGEPDEGMLALFDQPADGTLSLTAAIATMIHPDDAERYIAAVERASDPLGDGRLKEDIRVRRGETSWRWVSVTGQVNFDGVPPRPVRMTGTALDITERKELETALRESEERQAFLLKLSDALRPLADPVEIQGVAARMLGEELGASRAYYVEYDPRTRIATVASDYFSDGARSLVGRYGHEVYGMVLDRIGKGRTWEVEDVATDPGLSAADREVLAAQGLVAWIDVPLVKKGELVGVLCVVQGTPRQWTQAEVALVEETSQRVRAALERAGAETRLRESEANLALALEIGRLGMWWLDLRTGTLTASAECKANFGRGPDEPFGYEELGEAIHPDDRDYQARAVSEAIENKAELDIEYRCITPQGEERWVAILARFEDKNEGPRLAGVSEDITERKRFEELLRESEGRFRQFGGASSDVLWIRDAETLQWEYLSRAFEDIYGEKREAALTGDTMRRWAELILPEDREHAIANIRRVRAGEQVTFEYRIKRPSDGEIRWLRNTDFPLLDAMGRVQRIGGIGQDVTEEKETADRMDVMVAELQHRTRNLVAVMRGLADRTRRDSISLDDFLTRFSDRLQAVGRVQGLLSRLSEGRRISFDELLRTELAAHGATSDGKVTLEGPTGVPLRSSTVQTFALAVHELATNAVKYRALSVDGHLMVRWHVERGAGGNELHVDWRESGVRMPDPATSPQGSGYGRELIERALPYQLKARTTYDMGRDGVHCTIVVPVGDLAFEEDVK